MIKAAVKSFCIAIRLKFFRKKFYSKLLAYGCTIGTMKYDDSNDDLPVEQWKTNDENWQGDLPSIFNLDQIVEEMNNQVDDINRTFKLDVKEWQRDEVRFLMDRFAFAHNSLSKLHNKKFSLLETVSKIDDFKKSHFGAQSRATMCFAKKR